jgi:hypothetical protein
MLFFINKKKIGSKKNLLRTVRTVASNGAVDAVANGAMNFLGLFSFLYS